MPNKKSWEELLFQKHMKDAQRGHELLTDKEYIELEKQWKAASKDTRVRPIPDFGVKGFIDEIVKPRTERTASTIEKYCIDMEKQAMQTAIDFDSRAVYTRVTTPWHIKGEYKTEGGHK